RLRKAYTELGVGQAGGAACGGCAWLGPGHDRRARRAGDVKGREREGPAGVGRDQHLDEILVSVAEAQEGDVQRPGHLVDDRVGELETVLWMRRIRVGSRNEDRLGGEARAAVNRAAEAQLAGRV